MSSRAKSLHNTYCTVVLVREKAANTGKYCGKRVIFSPVNTAANWLFSCFGFAVSPMNTENH
jgi:hypothetical protein